MKNFNPLVLGVLVLCAMGLWGCNQQRTGVITNKIRDLETRCGKLEEENRALLAASEQNRRRLAAVEEERTALEVDKADLTKKLDTTSVERESLRKQLAQRTSERDTAQSHLMQFSKDLQALVGRVEAAVNVPANPAPSIIPASRRNE